MNIGSYRYVTDRAFDGMLAAVTDLGDELANTVPDLPGANSPWAIAYHCTEVVEYWIGHLLAGRPTVRDRAAEFVATGTVADLTATIEAARARLATDLAGFDPAWPLHGQPLPSYQCPDRSLNATDVLLHVLEELAQHHGQIEITRDVLRRG